MARNRRKIVLVDTFKAIQKQTQLLEKELSEKILETDRVLEVLRAREVLRVLEVLKVLKVLGGGRK